MKRDDAIEKLDTNPYDEITLRNEIDYICSKLNISKDELDKLMNGKNKTFKDYKSSYYLIQFFVKICKILNLEGRIIR